MTATSTETGLTRAQLMQIVRTGRETQGVGKMRALAALNAREATELRQILLDVVADRHELPRFRHMAALGLYQMGGAQAREALTAAARTADQATAPAIAIGLGRVGTTDSLKVLERLGRIAPMHAKDRLRFAATLLTYRHRLGGHDVKAIRPNALQEVGRRRTRAIESRPARTSEANRALEALVAEPLDVDLTAERALRIDCQPNTFIWLWTRDAAERGLSALVGQKCLGGVLFRKRLFQDAYVLSAIALATPMRGGTRLTLHKTATGTIVYAGTVSPRGLDLKARDRPGLAAVDIRARIEAGEIRPVVAKAAVLVREARTPSPA